MFTPRQSEIIGLLLRDMSIPAISRHFNISHDTAKEHLIEMRRKTQTTSKAALTSWLKETIILAQKENNDHL